MRPALVAVAALSALAVAVTADPASAATKQTARDLTVPHGQIGHGFKADVAPTLVRGPRYAYPGCSRITFVPRGGTATYESFFRDLSVSPDQTDEVFQRVELSTILTPSDASAATVVKAWKKADRACPDAVESQTASGVPADEELITRVGAAPRVTHLTSGFTQTVTRSGTFRPDQVDVPVSGTLQSAILQRHRAVAVVTVLDVHNVYTPAGDLVSEAYSSAPSVQRLLAAYAKLAVSSLGKQTLT